MNVQSPLVADGQPPEVVEPSQRALYHPAVPAQLLAALYTSSCYSRSDAPLPQGRSVSVGVVASIGMQLVRPLSRSASALGTSLDTRDSVYHHLQRFGIRNVSACASYCEGNSRSADHKMALRAWFALIRRIRPNCLAPFLARMHVESSAARDQSISPAACNSSSNTLCSFSHTPACCQSRSLRQHVIPEPQPISCGSSSHCKPVLSTNRMPVSAALLEMRGRPPLGLGGSGGKSGSITSHNSSVSSGFAIPHFTAPDGFC